ncbi:hypothetical protein ASG96_18920 [Terrabacter sp. Soil810]|nr:hypothetical protein ASG96_18920 [Terrabacter sp. Soil810]
MAFGGGYVPLLGESESFCWIELGGLEPFCLGNRVQQPAEGLITLAFASTLYRHFEVALKCHGVVEAGLVSIFKSVIRKERE